MPPPNTQNSQQEEVLEQQMKELHNNYIVAVQNLAVTSLESKKALITSWLIRDKLINDFFTFSLITLGAAATILTAKSSLRRAPQIGLYLVILMKPYLKLTSLE
jgi:hypothetical protein